MKLPNPYQADVRSFSDEELETLSSELEEEYTITGIDDAIWLDSAAEDRYWQIRQEIRRRWGLAHPGQRLNPRAVLALNLASNCYLPRVQIAEPHSRIGDTITVRTPQRFWGQGEQ